MGWTDQIRRIEIVLTGNADQGEQRIAAGIGKGRTHAMRGRGVGNGTDRPVGGDPFARRVRKDCREIDDAGSLTAAVVRWRAPQWKD